MLKKLLLTCLLLHTVTMGLPVAHAAELITPADETTTQTENTVATDQAPEVDQVETSNSQVNQDQHVNGDAGVIQDQTANHNLCQEQTVVASITCNNIIKSDIEGQIGQDQITNLGVSQKQSIESSESVDAVQNLDAGIDSELTQEVLFPTGESDVLSQGTEASTSQTQTVNTSSSAKIDNKQGTDITVSQLQDLDTTGSKEDEQEQQTQINASEKQKVETSGSASMEQTQTATVDSYFVDTLMEIAQIGVTVTTRNYIEVVKDTTSNFVNFFQEIMMNDQLVDRIDRQTALDVKDVHGSFQYFEKDYDWGKLVVKNSALLFLNGPLESYTTILKSNLSLVFGAELFGTPVQKPNDDGTPPDSDNGEDPVTPPGTEDGSHEEDPVTLPTEDGNHAEDPVTLPTEDGNHEEDPNTPPSGENEGAPSEGDNGGKLVTPTPVESEGVPTEVSNGETGGNSVISTQVNTGNSVTLNSSKNEEVKSTEGSKAVKGNELPNTASNNYNYLLFGIMLVLLSSVVFFKRKRL